MLIPKYIVYMFKMKNQMYFISKNVKSDIHYPKLGLFCNIWFDFLPQSDSSDASPQSSYNLSHRKTFRMHFPLKHRNWPFGQPVNENKIKKTKKGNPRLSLLKISFL